MNLNRGKSFIRWYKELSDDLIDNTVNSDDHSDIQRYLGNFFEIIVIIILLAIKVVKQLFIPIVTIPYLIIKYQVKQEEKRLEAERLKKEQEKIDRVKTIIKDWEDKILKEAFGRYYYFKDFKNHCVCFDEFIQRFIIEFNNNYSTYQDGKLICNKDRRRSLGDIFLICKYYYPEVTMQRVLIELLKLLNNRYIAGSYCNTIHKYVFHKSSRHIGRSDKVEYSNEINFGHILDAYGFKPKNAYNESVW